MTEPVHCAILGSGNIGTDLMIKILRNGKTLKPTAMVGVDPDSDGQARAQRLGVATTHGGLAGLHRSHERPEDDRLRRGRVRRALPARPFRQPRHHDLGRARSRRTAGRGAPCDGAGITPDRDRDALDAGTTIGIHAHHKLDLGVANIARRSRSVTPASTPASCDMRNAWAHAAARPRATC